MNEIYFDNSATTPLRREVISVMTRVMEDTYGNPSSLHSKGVEAERILTDTRDNILRAMKIRQSQNAEIIFCGSGTEANNLAVFGTVRAKNKKTKRVITTDSEHPSVLEPLKALESEGVEVIRLSTHGGVIDIDELKSAVTPDTMLVSIMLVNNETGALYDVKTAFSIVKKMNPAAVTHCDAVQGFGKAQFSPHDYGIDLMSVSAHKLGGPKGIGALYCNRAVITSRKLIPHIYGGGQEIGLRSGTENTVAIAGFGEAVKYAMDLNGVTSLKNHFIEKLPSEVTLNTPNGGSVPYIVSITLPGIKSETMLHFLSSKGIYVSSGSACSSNTGHLSYALLNFGLDKQAADCTLRISFNDANTKEQIDIFTEELQRGLDTLVRIKK
jgi:Cysteine sulfinate desulfinase/cysteine desulfurase and related enzymes